MIIEFFGPPGVGKTTLAHALHLRLCEQGQNVRLISSYRPGETRGDMQQPAHRSGGAAIQRAIRAISELTNLMRKRSDIPDQAKLATALLRSIRPRGFGRSARMNQYLCRLAHNWSFASARSEITIFDQAFVQAVYSLAESNGCPLQLDNALSLIPIPDILIGLSISKEELSRRLGERRQRQGRLERLLETSPAKNVASVEIFASLDERLGKRGIRVIKIGTDGPHDVDAAARSIAETIQTVTRRTPETVAG